MGETENQEEPGTSSSRLHPLARVALFSAAFFFAFYFLISLAASILSATTEDPESVVTDLQAFLETGAGILAFYAIAAPFVWFLTYSFRRRIDGESFRSLGFPAGTAVRSFVRGWIGGVLASGAMLLIGLAAGVYRFGGAVDSSEIYSGATNGIFSPDLASGGFGTVVLIGVGFLLHAFTEELVFRGYVQKNIEQWRKGSILWVLVVPSLLFGLMHAGSGEFGAIPMVNTVLGGILFGSIVIGSGQLWSVSGVHAGWNFGLAGIWSLPVSGVLTQRLLQVQIIDGGETKSLMFGSNYGPEGGLVVTLLVVVLLSWSIPRAIDAWDAKTGIDRKV